MKINAIQNNNCSTKNNKISFTAGVTNLYSDFDGTYMPREYRHDAFCKEGSSERHDFLTTGKIKFQEYFDKFKQLLLTAKGTKKDKFNFTITSGRNRFEYNYYMKRIREDNLSIPLPDKLVVNNGGDVYSLRKDMTDFFKTDYEEPFLITDFSQSKRSKIKKLAGAWDGENVRKRILSDINTKVYENELQAARDFSFLTGNPDLNYSLNACRELLASDMDKDALRLHIQYLANDLKNRVEKDDELKKIYQNPGNIDWLIGEFADRLAYAKENRPIILDTPTDGYFYGGKELNSVINNDFSSQLKPFIAFREDGDLGLHLSLSKNISDNENINNIKSIFEESVPEAYFRINNEPGKLGEITILPKLSDGPLDKSIDPKLQLKKVLKNNDLIITAGDSSNDISMLNLFEYINCDKFEFSKENLEKIYKLPIISIYVDNSAIGKDLNDKKLPFGLAKIDNYFNSDGNIRFIHVDAKDPTKPHNLQEAVQVAIREYAKRNEIFKNNLPENMKKLISEIDYEYPIDKNVVINLEKKLNAKLWNPVPNLSFENTKDNLKEKINAGTPLISENDECKNVVSETQGPEIKVPETKEDGIKVSEKAVNLSKKNKIIIGILAGLGLLTGLYFYIKNKKVHSKNTNFNNK